MPPQQRQRTTRTTKAKTAASAPPARGRLKSMRVSEGFKAFVLEQLAQVEGLYARAMFGGVGLYAEDTFFGILAADTLYFKVDDSNREQYEAAGMPVFKPYADRHMTMPYYQVPLGVIEDIDELATWANASIRVATRARQKPAAKKTRASRR